MLNPVTDRPHTTELKVIVKWFEELKRLVPTGKKTELQPVHPEPNALVF